MSRIAKYASLVITLVGAVTHSYLALQLASAWRTLRLLVAENELDAWKLDGLKVLWGLLAAYLLAAAFVSFVGFCGVLRNKPTHVRLYRDCSLADLAFTAFLTALAAYAAWAPGRSVCEELARQPELAQLLTLLASDEACERSLERTAAALLAGMLVLTVVRLHFLLAVSTHYRHMLAAGGHGVAHSIRLLPLPPNVNAAEVVYAPVHAPAGSVLARGGAAEVWVRTPGPLDPSVVEWICFNISCTVLSVKLAMNESDVFLDLNTIRIGLNVHSAVLLQLAINLNRNVIFHGGRLHSNT